MYIGIPVITEKTWDRSHTILTPRIGATIVAHRSDRSRSSVFRWPMNSAANPSFRFHEVRTIGRTPSTRSSLSTRDRARAESIASTIHAVPGPVPTLAKRCPSEKLLLRTSPTKTKFQLSKKITHPPTTNKF